MLWFFCRGRARLRVLMAQRVDTGEYIVELDWPDRRPEIHRFADAARCSEYLSALDEELAADNWVADGLELLRRRA